MKTNLIELYNRELSSTEISLLYNKALYTPPPIQTNLPDYFKSDGDAYIDFNNKQEYKLQNIEVEQVFLIQGYSQRGLFRAWSDYSNNDPYAGNNGFYTFVTSTGKISMVWGTIQESVTSNLILKLNKLNRTNIKLYGGNKEIWINGLLDNSDTTSQPITYNPDDPGHVTRFGELDFSIYLFDGKLTMLRYYELDASGNRIKELINLDFRNISGTTVPNVAADAPPSSDGTIIPNGATSYVGNDSYKEVFNLDLTRGIIPSTDKYGNSITNNGVESKKVGKVSSGYSTGVDSQYLDLSNIGNLYDIDLVFCFWLKSLSSLSDRILTKGSLIFKWDTNRVSIFPNAIDTTKTDIVDLNKWNNVIFFVQKNGNVQPYVNGSYSFTSTTGNVPIVDNSSDVMTAYAQNGGSREFYGFIPQIKIYQGIPADPAAFAAREYNANKWKFGS